MTDILTTPGAPRFFAFGAFVLIPARQLLLERGSPVRIGGRALDILTALVSRSGEVVSKRELQAFVWPDTVVEESNLKVNMAALRRVLGERPETPQYIATVAGRGYRFVATVKAFSSAEPPVVAGVVPKIGLQLPTTATQVIGRDAAIEGIRLALESTRLVSIVGPGGIGKTTVAVAIARFFEDEGGVEVTFVDLARVASGEFVVASLLAALGISSGSDDGLRTIASILARRNALLVFDTCEHVLGAVAHVCHLILAKAEGVRILATSRQVLDVPGEKVQWLGPLEVPPPDALLSAKEVLRYAAPQLLVERVSEKTGFVLEDADARSISDICRRLDGKPLAIELVAARLAGRSPDAVLRELDDRFKTLRQARPGRPLRQQTLLATLEWSYALLTTLEARTLRAVSIFAGAFDIDSAVAATAHQHISVAETCDAISGLRTKSLLSLDHASGELRYRLLDTTRAFAAGLMESDGELAEASLGHARLLLKILTRAGSEHLSSPAWHASYGGYMDDLRKALDWSLYQGGDPMLGIQLVAAGLPLWREFSLGEEIRRNCERAVAEFEKIGCTEPRLKLKLLVGLASANTYLSKDPRGTALLFEKAIQLAREMDDALSECRLLGSLVTYQVLPGSEHDAHESLRAMRAAALRTKRESERWDYELLCAEWESLIPDYGRAIQRLETLKTDVGDGASEDMADSFKIRPDIKIGTHLGALLWLTGRPKRGIRLSEEAVKKAVASQHGLTLILILAHGAIWTMTNSHYYRRAGFYASILRDAVYRHGMAAWIPIANYHSEAIAALSGRNVNPEGLREAYLGLRRGAAQLGRQSYYATTAHAMLAIGQPGDAARTIDYVLDAGVQRWALPEFLRLRAATERAFGRDHEARATLLDSVKSAVENGSLAWELRSTCDLAVLLKDHGEPKEARRILSPVYARYSDGLVTGDLHKARNLLLQMDFTAPVIQ